MTPFGTTVARELRSALGPIETATIVDYRYLPNTSCALVNIALFYVVPTDAIYKARAAALSAANALAETIHEVGVQPQGVSLVVDQARADAIVAWQALVDSVADAEPTAAARCLGIA